MCWLVCPFDSVLPLKSTSVTLRCCRGPTSWNVKTSEATVQAEKQTILQWPERACSALSHLDPAPTFIYRLCRGWVEGRWLQWNSLSLWEWPETERHPSYLSLWSLVFKWLSFQPIGCSIALLKKETAVFIVCFLTEDQWPFCTWKGSLRKLLKGGWALHNLDHLWAQVPVEMWSHTAESKVCICL